MAVKLFLTNVPEEMETAEELVEAVGNKNEWDVRVAEANEEAMKVHVENLRDPNLLNLENRQMRRAFKQFQQPKIFTALAIAAMVVTSEKVAEAGAIEHLAGNDRSAMAQMYRDIDRGDEGYADLDAVEAALDSTGSTDEAALIAVGVNLDASEIYSSPDSAHVEPTADFSVDSYETITIKQ